VSRPLHEVESGGWYGSAQALGRNSDLNVIIDESTSPGSPDFSVTLVDLTLVEVTVSHTGASSPVPNGACYTIAGPVTLSTPEE